MVVTQRVLFQEEMLYVIRNLGAEGEGSPSSKKVGCQNENLLVSDSCTNKSETRRFSINSISGGRHGI
jgi:hypothetical protein